MDDNDPNNTTPTTPDSETPTESPNFDDLSTSDESEDMTSADDTSSPEPESVEPNLSAVPEEEPKEDSPEEESTQSTDSVNFNDFPSSTEEKPAEEPAPMSFAPEPKSKKKSSSTALMLAAIFLALVGIGFGVYGMFFQNPKTVEKRVEVPAKCDEEETTSTTSSSDYIYIGEWGIKIKKPEGLTRMSYLIDTNSNETLLAQNDTNSNILSKITFWDNEKRQDQKIYPEFSMPSKNATGLGSLIQTRIDCSIDENKTLVTKIGENEEFFICYQAPQPVDNEWQTATINLIQTWLTTKENYSKF